MTTIARDDSAPAHAPVFREANLWIIFSITWTSMMGVGSLTPIFPSVMDAFAISHQEVGLLITVFTLPGIFLAPFVGLLADRHGRRKVLVPSLLLFAAAGTGCAFADDFTTLLVLRTLQGCGGAGLNALNNTVIGDLYSGRRRMEAIGYNASVHNLATLSNPLLGGAIALFGWHYPFLLPLIALPVAYFVAFHLKNPEPKRTLSFREYMGGAVRGLATRRMIALMGSSFISVVIAFGVLMVYIALLMKDRFGAGPLEIGIVVAFSSIVATLVSSLAVRLTAFMSYRQMIVAGTLLSAAGVALNPLMPSLWLLLVPGFVKGIAQGIQHPATYTLVLEAAPVDGRAAVMAFNGMIHRIGQTLGPLIFGVTYTFGGMDAVFDGAAALLVVTAIAVWFALGPGTSLTTVERSGRAH